MKIELVIGTITMLIIGLFFNIPKKANKLNTNIKDSTIIVAENYLNKLRIENIKKEHSRIVKIDSLKTKCTQKDKTIFSLKIINSRLIDTISKIDTVFVKRKKRFKIF